MILKFLLNGSASDLGANELDLKKHLKEVESFNSNRSLKLLYFGNIKTGHIPCYREIEISGDFRDLVDLVEWMEYDGSFLIVNKS